MDDGLLNRVRAWLVGAALLSVIGGGWFWANPDAGKAGSAACPLLRISVDARELGVLIRTCGTLPLPDRGFRLRYDVLVRVTPLSVEAP
jgi:hypothetical protein